jgi:hypothetical protein
MTVEEYRRAVDAGLGRAALCLLENDPEPYIPQLTAACLVDPRVEVYTDEPRGAYLAQLAKLAGAEEVVANAIFEAWPRAEDDYDLRQMVLVLAELVRRGYERPRLALLARSIRDDTPLIALAHFGAPGLEWLMHVRPDLFEGEEATDVAWMIRTAERISGTERVEAILTESARQVRRRAADEEAAQDAERKARPTVNTYHELMAQYKANRDPGFRDGLVHRFGLNAPDEELRKMAEYALRLNTATQIKRFTRVFSHRPWPLDPALLISRIDEEDSGFYWRRVLESVQDVRVRELALERMRMEPPDVDSAAYLRANYQEGDEEALLDFLRRVRFPNAATRHNVSVDIRRIAEKSEAKSRISLFEWVIENSGCSFCRHGSYKQLLQAGALRDDYRKEMPYDVDEETRKLI